MWAIAAHKVVQGKGECSRTSKQKEWSQLFSAKSKKSYIIDKEKLIYQFHTNVTRSPQNSAIATRKSRKTLERIFKSLC